ncbi:575_t:CDS:2, partial [Cetraspora pellucida]
SEINPDAVISNVGLGDSKGTIKADLKTLQIEDKKNNNQASNKIEQNQTSIKGGSNKEEIECIQSESQKVDNEVMTMR